MENVPRPDAARTATELCCDRQRERFGTNWRVDNTHRVRELAADSRALPSNAKARPANKIGLPHNFTARAKMRREDPTGWTPRSRTPLETNPTPRETRNYPEPVNGTLSNC